MRYTSDALKVEEGAGREEGIGENVGLVDALPSVMLADVDTGELVYEIDADAVDVLPQVPTQ